MPFGGFYVPKSLHKAYLLGILVCVCVHLFLVFCFNVWFFEMFLVSVLMFWFLSFWVFVCVFGFCWGCCCF